MGMANVNDLIKDMDKYIMGVQEKSLFCTDPYYVATSASSGSCEKLPTFQDLTIIYDKISQLEEKVELLLKCSKDEEDDE